KRAEPRRPRRRAERRKPQRRDNPNQQVTARTFHRRTQTSEAERALQKKRRDLQAKLVVSFCYRSYRSYSTYTVCACLPSLSSNLRFHQTPATSRACVRRRTLRCTSSASPAFAWTIARCDAPVSTTGRK